MRIAQYQGISWISKAIRWQTKSIYSHTALLLDDNTVIEAWAAPFPGEVRHVAGLSMQHTPGTKVDIFEFEKPLTPMEGMTMERMAQRYIEQKYHYAYLDIVRFVTHEKGRESRAVFCSELAFEVCAEAGRRLLERCNAWEIPPRDIARSPLLRFSKTIITR